MDFTLHETRKSRMGVPELSRNITDIIDNKFDADVSEIGKGVVCAVTCLTILFGTFGNAMSFYPGFRCKRLRSNFDVLLINLAATDLIVCSILAPVFLYLLFSVPQNLTLFCPSLLFTSSVCVVSSLVTLVTIALHRQARVIWHSKASVTDRQMAFILVFLWILSIAMSFAGTVHTETFTDWGVQKESCLPVINSGVKHRSNLIAFFIGPLCALSLLLMIAAYGTVVYAVQIRKKVRRTSSPSIDRHRTLNLTHANAWRLEKSESGKRSDEKLWKHEASQSAKRADEKLDTVTNDRSSKHQPTYTVEISESLSFNAMRTCLLVTLTHLVCWAPMIIIQWVELAFGESFMLFQFKICGIAFVLLNSALNPYLYAPHSGRLKYHIYKIKVKLLKCSCTSKKRNEIKALGEGSVDANLKKSSHDRKISPRVLQVDHRMFDDRLLTPIPAGNKGRQPVAMFSTWKLPNTYVIGLNNNHIPIVAK